jgi:hypothetical protein
VLFFVLGMIAAVVRSDLDLPAPIPKFLAMYLLLAIGFKGGVELTHAPITGTIVLTLGVAAVTSAIFPLWVFALMRRPMGVPNAAAVAAAYGSVSAVTFVTAAAFLERLAIPFGGHMVAALALMESPAIIVGVLLYRLAEGKQQGKGKLAWGALMHDAFLNGSVLLLMGSFIIGMLVGEGGAAPVKPFTGALFPGVLCLFLLDMGLLAGKRLHDLRRAGLAVPLAGIGFPIVHAGIGIALAWLLGLGQGDALLMAVLCASASYIAVPAAVRLAIPKASPSIYVSMSLAVTFPFNILIGLPLYLALIRAVW